MKETWKIGKALYIISERSFLGTFLEILTAHEELKKNLSHKMLTVPSMGIMEVVYSSEASLSIKEKVNI
jgi:hypothetical protein